METKIYAAYGSNMNIEQMKRRCPKAKVIDQGELYGYKLTFRGSGAGMANVENCNKGHVPIVLWAITKECEKALDRYEGYPTLYIKKEVKIATIGGEQAAMVYVMTKKYEDMPALPSERYLGIIRQGYQDNGMNIAPLIEALTNTKDEAK